MTEEVVKTSPESESKQVTEVTKAEPTELELKAREQGWVPKEEFNGEEHMWYDAGEFLRRGPLFQKIDSVSKENKDLKLALREMKNLQAKIRETEYANAIRDLKAKKRDALAEGDADAVIDAEEKIELVKEEQLQLREQNAYEPPVEAELQPEFVDWKTRNPWYSSTPHMKVFADTLGIDLAKQGVPKSEVLKKVEAAVRKEFPNKFRNPNQDKPGAVESGTSKTTTSSSFQLTDDEHRAMKTFVRQGIMTEAEYKEQLKKVRN